MGEVADAYRSNETRVQAALRTPPPKPKHTTLGRFFGVYSDPRAYLGMAYMLPALATGPLYFTLAVTGSSPSAGLASLTIGIPANMHIAALRANAGNQKWHIANNGAYYGQLLWPGGADHQ